MLEQGEEQFIMQAVVLKEYHDYTRRQKKQKERNYRTELT